MVECTMVSEGSWLDMEKGRKTIGKVVEGGITGAGWQKLGGEMFTACSAKERPCNGVDGTLSLNLRSAVNEH